jgi:hypothetical protein
MQAYANVGRLPTEARLHSLESARPCPEQNLKAAGTFDLRVIDGLLGRLADLVVERLTERTMGSDSHPHDEWMDARSAAAYLGVHRDTVRKLAAERAIPRASGRAGLQAVLPPRRTR